MDDTRAAEILKSLAAGEAPDDGGRLQTPDVVRALFLAAESLEARLVKHGRLEAEQASTARLR